MAEFGFIDQPGQGQFGFLDEGEGREPSPMELDNLFQTGVLRDLTPQQALAIQQHRRDSRGSVGAMLSAVPAAMGQAGSDLYEGAKEGVSNVAAPHRNVLGLAEGAIRGTADLGKLSSDIIKGRILDPLRINVGGADPGEVARQRLMEDRQWRQDRQAVIDGTSPSYIQDIATVALNAVPGVSEETALSIADKLEPPRKFAEAMSYVADPMAVVPGVAPLTKLGKAGKMARATEAVEAAATALPHLREAGASVMVPSKPIAGALQQALPAKSGLSAVPSRFASGVERVAASAAATAQAVDDKLDSVKSVVRPAAIVAGALDAGSMGALVGYKAPEAVRAIAKGAEGVQQAATALRYAADADWASRVPVWMQIAKNPDAPGWLKKAVTAKPFGAHLASMAETGARASVAAGKGAATGAAIGGGLMFADPNKSGEEIGAGLATGIALGAGGAMVGRAASKKERIAQAANYDKLRFVDQAIKDGADPSVAVSASPAVLDTAVVLQTLFRGAFKDGQSLSVRLVPPGHQALGGQVASFDPTTSTAYLDISANDPDGRLLHESIGHGLMSSIVADRPGILTSIDSMMTPEAIQAAKEDYARAMGHTDESMMNTYIEAQNNFDPYWAHHEIFAEMAAHTLRGQDLLAGVNTILGRRGRQTFFKDPTVRKAIFSEQASNLVKGEFEALQGFRPGVDNTRERGRKMSTDMAGNHPALPVEVRPDGTTGNDFVTVTPDGRAIPRPQKQVRRIVKNRQREMRQIFPDQAPVAWNEGDQVRTRVTPSGLVEKTGKRLGDRWYAEAQTFSDSAKQLARQVEQAIEEGTPLASWYQQVIPEARGTIKDTLGGMEAQFKDFVPYAFKVDKRNNVHVQNYSLTSLERKAQRWADRSGELSLDMWDGDIGAFRQDVQTYLKNHAEGRPGADTIGDRKRDLINAFLVGRNATFGDVNPLRDRLRGEDRTGIIRSYRLDRIQTVDPSQLTGYDRPSYVKQLRNQSPAVSPDLPKDPNQSKGITDEGRKTSIPASSFRIDPVTRGLRFEEGIQRTAREHPLGEAVDVKSREFYTSRGTDLFLAPDGLAGVAVTDYGDLVSVFKHPTSQQKIGPLLLDASKVSITLDAYDINGFLPDLYRGYGFKPVAIVRWNEAYMKPNWPLEKAGRPNVVLMVRDPNGVLPEFNSMAEVRESLPIFDEWDDAAAIQEQAKQKVIESGLPDYVRHSPAVEPDVPGKDEHTTHLMYARGANGKIKYDKDNNEVIVAQTYNFLESPVVQKVIDAQADPARARKVLGQISTILNKSTLENRRQLNPEQKAIYDQVIDSYSDEFAVDFGRWKDDPDIIQAIGWYSGVASRIKSIIPDTHERHMFLEFLGGTSPNTSVEQNFLYAIDLFNRWRKGDLNQYVAIYDRLRESHRSGDLVRKYWNVEEIKTPQYAKKGKRYKKDSEGNRIVKRDRQGNIKYDSKFKYTWKDRATERQFINDWATIQTGSGKDSKFAKELAKARKTARRFDPSHLVAWRLMAEGGIPVRRNGGKYGVHTDRIFQIMARTWEADSDAPKAVNFTGNLKGTRFTATIDVWAARFLRRIGYEPAGGRWRIQPKAETGVKNNDFFFGQDVFDAATKKIGDQYGEQFRMNSDDLQAVMWFAEKREWAKRGWSDEEVLGDFRDYLYKMQQGDDGQLSLVDATLDATSQDFLDSLDFAAQNVRLPAELRKLQKALLDARKAVADRIRKYRGKLRTGDEKEKKAARRYLDKAITRAGELRQKGLELDGYEVIVNR